MGEGNDDEYGEVMYTTVDGWYGIRFAGIGNTSEIVEYPPQCVEYIDERAAGVFHTAVDCEGQCSTHSW